MGDTLHVGLTETQRELLLRGLRYVRSSIQLNVQDPTPELEAERTERLHEVGELVEQLSGAHPPRETAKV